MTQIPLVPVTFNEKGTPMTGKISFSGYAPVIHEIGKDLKSCVSGVADKFGRGSPMVMIDIDGMSRLDTDPRALKKLRTKRLNALIMTGIVNLDDLFDAFYIGIEGLAVPYHTVSSDSVMKEINRLSDKVVPVIFTNGRNATTSKGPENVMFSLRKLRTFGFKRIGVIDVSGRFDREMWISVFDESAGVIPFVYDQTPETEAALSEIGFRDIFIECP